jgi:SPP1 gp7 family putative phage head morphogenesis protein
VQDKIVALVSRKLTSGELTTKFVNDLELRGVGQLVPTLREVLSAAFRQGQQAIKAEIKKGSQGVTRNATAEAKALVEAQPEWDHARIVTALKTYKVTHTLEGLPPEKALEFFESKATLWGAQIRDPLLIEIKMILFDAIKMGTPLREVQANLARAFLPWLGDPSHIIDDKILEPYRLEAMIRTNTIEALNEGRKAQAQPEVESGFITGFMFSAILDDRVTPVCSYLDAKIFRPNSPELDRLSPPRRFNCRSILVPILRTEGPVTYITPSQVAKGVALSGKGFCQEHAHA